MPRVCNFCWGGVFFGLGICFVLSPHSQKHGGELARTPFFPSPPLAARPPSRFDCLSAEELVTRLVTGLQRCCELSFFHLNLWGVFCSVESLLLHGSSLLRGASLLRLERLLLCGASFALWSVGLAAVITCLMSLLPRS